MEWQGDVVEARGAVPIPRAQPTAPRRVSFAPAEQVRGRALRDIAIRGGCRR